MRLLLDMNMPPALAEWLASAGHDAVHVREIGSENASDEAVFARARDEGRIVVTFDLDFGDIVRLAASAQNGVVLLRLRSIRAPQIRERLGLALAETGEALQAGAIVLVEDARIRAQRIRENPAPIRNGSNQLN